MEAVKARAAIDDGDSDDETGMCGGINGGLMWNVNISRAESTGFFLRKLSKPKDGHCIAGECRQPRVILIMAWGFVTTR